MQLLPRALPYAHTALSDAELAVEDAAALPTTVKPGTAAAQPRAPLTEAPARDGDGVGHEITGRHIIPIYKVPQVVS